MFSNENDVRAWFANLMGVSEDNVEIDLTDSGAYYVYSNTRGGSSAVATSENDFLLASSAEPPETHIQRFQNGERSK